MFILQLLYQFDFTYFINSFSLPVINVDDINAEPLAQGCCPGNCLGAHLLEMLHSTVLIKPAMSLVLSLILVHTLS